MESGTPNELSELQKEVLIGSLLGDAHISKPKKTTHNSYLVIIGSWQMSYI